MAKWRLFTDNAMHVGKQVVLESGPSQHLLKVLRCRLGESCYLFNGNGIDYFAQLDEVRSKQAVLTVRRADAVQNESPVDIHLVQGVSRGERMDYAVQKSVECGVASITPLLTERCNVKLSGERALKRQRHWQAIAVSAAEQCGRARVPQVGVPVKFGDWLLHNRLPGVIADTSQQPNRNWGAQVKGELVLLIGPEGGFSSEELSHCWASGIYSMSLGPRILRTETACVVALTQLQLRFGDMSGAWDD